MLHALSTGLAAPEGLTTIGAPRSNARTHATHLNSMAKSFLRREIRPVINSFQHHSHPFAERNHVAPGNMRTGGRTMCLAPRTCAFRKEVRIT